MIYWVVSPTRHVELAISNQHRNGDTNEQDFLGYIPAAVRLQCQRACRRGQRHQGRKAVAKTKWATEEARKAAAAGLK